MSGAEAAEEDPGNPELLNDLAARIRRHGAIPFDIFMDSVLYGPAGYYQRSSGVIGRGGDFVTATETSGDFGRVLARQICECLESLGGGDLDIVELGAGRGTLASDILEDIEANVPALASRIHYWIVERSSAMRAEQSRVLDARVRSGCVAWAEAVDRIRTGGIRGCIIANEFYDALPVKVVLRRGDTLHERHVGLSERGDRLIWVDRPVSDPALAAYSDRYGLASEDGAVAEAGLEAMIHARRTARVLARGFAIVIDYGDRAKSLYDPSVRRAGTLVGYHRHRVCENPLARVGEQDLTAHVNFSALEDSAADEGMQTHGWTSQGHFLIALGMAERIAELAGSSDPDVLRRRMAMMSLIHPEGMGERFRVLVQAKDVSKRAWTGLDDPFAGIDGRKAWQAPTS